MELLKSRNQRQFAFVLTCVYAAIVLIVSLHHEPWRDEADPWLATRDMSLPQLFRWLGPAGTPGLWYLLLMPLAKLGLPYASMSLLHAGLAITAAGVFAFAAPFPRLFKVLILFGKILLYEYAIIARSYVLTYLLLMLIARVLTREKKRWWLLGILLFFLFNANVHSFCIAGAICLVMAFEMWRRREWSGDAAIGGSIAALGGILALLQILPAAHVYTGIPPGWPAVGDALSQAFFPYLPAYIGFFRSHSHGHEWVAEANYAAFRCFGAVLLLAILYQLKRAPQAIAIFILSALPLCYIFATRWYGGDRHAGLVFLLLVFAMWLGGWPSEQSEGNISGLTAFALAVTLFLSSAAAIAWSWQDIRYDYSGSRSAAQFIRDQSLTRLSIAAFPEDRTESLLPYLPGTRFWYVTRREFGTFVDWKTHWNVDAESFTDQEIIGRVHQQFSSTPHVLVMAERPLANPSTDGYQLIFHNTERLFGEHARSETYYIYKPAPHQ
jgi:hypothetical protein